MKHIIIFISVVLGIAIFSSFAKKQMKSQEELMEEYIAEKIEIVREVNWEACYVRIEKDAVAYVDSIIDQMVKFQINDTIKTPGKPIRPEKPFDTLILDTTPIKPIISEPVKKKEDIIPIQDTVSIDSTTKNQ